MMGLESEGWVEVDQTQEEKNIPERQNSMMRKSPVYENEMRS